MLTRLYWNVSHTLSTPYYTGQLTSPEPVLKNRFLVPECDLSLLSETGVDVNVRCTSIDFDEEAMAEEPVAMGLKRLAMNDIVLYRGIEL